jgi:hypothetical protein
MGQEIINRLNLCIMLHEVSQDHNKPFDIVNNTLVWGGSRFIAHYMFIKA